jgi:hypothetical protein
LVSRKTLTILVSRTDYIGQQENTDYIGL